MVKIKKSARLTVLSVLLIISAIFFTACSSSSDKKISEKNIINKYSGSFEAELSFLPFMSYTGLYGTSIGTNGQGFLGIDCALTTYDSHCPYNELNDLLNYLGYSEYETAHAEIGQLMFFRANSSDCIYIFEMLDSDKNTVYMGKNGKYSSVRVEGEYWTTELADNGAYVITTLRNDKGQTYAFKIYKVTSDGIASTQEIKYYDTFKRHTVPSGHECQFISDGRLYITCSFDPGDRSEILAYDLESGETFSYKTEYSIGKLYKDKDRLAALCRESQTSEESSDDPFVQFFDYDLKPLDRISVEETDQCGKLRISDYARHSSVFCDGKIYTPLISADYSTDYYAVIDAYTGKYDYLSEIVNDSEDPAYHLLNALVKIDGKYISGFENASI